MRMRSDHTGCKKDPYLLVAGLTPDNLLITLHQPEIRYPFF